MLVLTAIDASAAPELVEYGAVHKRLRGFMYSQPAQMRVPAVLYLHGSEFAPGTRAGQAAYFGHRGYALFVPHRSGHGRSKHAGPHINAIWRRGDVAAVMAVLESHLSEMQQALSWLREQPEIDPHRIAVAGCSIGGVLSLMLAAEEPGLQAAVNFSGGAMIWDQIPRLRERMREAARKAAVPTLFIQAENDFSTAPSRVLFDIRQRQGLPGALSIFPPNGKTPQQGHNFCVGGESPPWGDVVGDFLQVHLR